MTVPEGLLEFESSFCATGAVSIMGAKLRRDVANAREILKAGAGYIVRAQNSSIPGILAHLVFESLADLWYTACVLGRSLVPGIGLKSCAVGREQWRRTLLDPNAKASKNLAP